MTSNLIMTTIYDLLVKEYTYFNYIRRPRASLKNVKCVDSPIKEPLWLLKKLYALYDYN